MTIARLLAVTLLAGTAGVAAHEAAADWPEKPVRVIVPFQAGGTSDQVARTYQRAIEENEILEQPVTVINQGGHYSIGARRVMEAEPDGHTFLLIHIALMGGEGSGAMDFGWRDFAPVAATGQFCLSPMVRKDSGIDSVEALLETAAERADEGDPLIFGANLGAINHMAGILVQNQHPEAEFRFVQIGGGTANFTALTGAQTNVTVLSAAEVLNFTRLPDGSEDPEAQIKPLAYTGPERSEHLPELPTMKELGYDMEFCIDNWWFAPKDTSEEAIQGMAEALREAQQTDRVKQFEEERAFGSVFLSGEELQNSLEATWERIEPIAKQAAAAAED